MYAEQDNTDYGSRVWQLDKLQKLKLRDSQQNDKLLKGVYSVRGTKQKKTETTAAEKWSIKGVILEKYWVLQYTHLCLVDGSLYRKHQTEPN